MGQVVINDKILKDTANAIRTKTGSSKGLTVDEFAQSILDIEQEYTPPEKGIRIDSVNTNGKPTKITLIGFTSLPAYYFYDGISPYRYFQSCTTIELPETITSIGQLAFADSTNLAKLNMLGPVTSIANTVFKGCTTLSFKEYPLPDTIKTLGGLCFSGCTALELKDNKLPDSLEALSESCFQNCSKLKLDTIPENITVIPKSCFEGCTALSFNAFPSTLKRIEERGFMSCSNIEINELPDSIEYMGTYALYGLKKCYFTKLPDDLKELGDNPFYQVNVNLTYLPDKLEKLGKNVFASSSTVIIDIDTLPESLTYLNDNAFQSNKGLKIKKLPDNLTYIGSSCFYNTDIEIDSIPKPVTTIKSSSFYGCKGINKLTCKGKITSIEAQAFYNASNLTKLLLPNITKVPTLANTNALSGTPIANKTGYIEVPHNLLSSMQSASNWSTYKTQIVGLELTSLAIVNDNINKFRNNCEITVLYNDTITNPEALGEYAGYTLTCSDNATIDGNMLTLNEDAQVGDVVTITATSTYNPEITTTKEIEIIYKEAYYEIELNDGQWVDSGETVNGNTVYKSDVGSYNINNGKSTATITVNGMVLLKLYIRSYAESSYDYTEAFEIDTPANRSKGKFTTKNNQSNSTYTECIYELDGGTHTIDIMYSKDSSGNSYDDRGYFYIGEYE